GGIRIPFVVKWPTVVRPQSGSKNPVIVEDLFSTIRAIAGVEDRKVVQTVDGINLLPYLQDADLVDSTRALVWHHPNRWIKEDFSSSSWASALRIGDWKLIYDYTKKKLELYNLESDIGEKYDLANLHPKKTKELAELLTQKLKEREAQLPRVKATERLIPLPNEIELTTQNK